MTTSQPAISAAQRSAEVPPARAALRAAGGRTRDACAIFRWPLRPDTLVFIAIIVVLNWPLLVGEMPLRWTLHPQRLMEGEWWRLFTHAFVHVTWYHLLLDAGAFLLLYEGLKQNSWLRRLGCVVGSGAGALLTCWLASPDFSQTGLCGLSGAAHGLMAIAGLELVGDRQSTRGQRRAGWIAFAVVVLKAGGEMLTGQVAFQWLHFGLMGRPLAASHAGGVLGGLLVAVTLLSKMRPFGGRHRKRLVSDARTGQCRGAKSFPDSGQATAETPRSLTG